MPNPVGSDLYVNLPLTNVVVAYMQDNANFIADEVFPNVASDVQTGIYYAYDRTDWLRAEMKERGPAAESAGSGWHVSLQPPYYCRVNALHKDIDDQLRGNFRAPFDLDRDTALWLGRQAMLKKEADFVANYFGTGIWTGATNGGDLTGVTGSPNANQFKQWDQAGSTPIEDLRKQKRNVGQVTGYTPNKLILGPQVFDVLCDHAEILDRIKYTQRGVVTEDILASVLGIPEVLVPAAVRVTANEGAASPTSTFDYGKAALMLYAAPAPSVMQPSAGYTFSWVGYMGAGGLGQRVTTFRMPHLRADRVECELAYDMKVIGSDLGVFFTTAIS
jgi:major capsid protein E